jgi:hypothetical protein
VGEAAGVVEGGTVTHTVSYHPDYVPALEARVERLRQVAEAARVLMILKQHRDLRGKTPEYQQMKPPSWQKLHEALVSLLPGDLDPPPVAPTEDAA